MILTIGLPTWSGASFSCKVVYRHPITDRNFSRVQDQFIERLSNDGSPGLMTAWRGYTTDKSDMINNFLRSRVPETSSEAEKWYAGNLERSFEYGATLAEGKVVYRGVAIRPDRIPKQGDVFIEEAFLSASLVKETAITFAGINVSSGAERGRRKVLFIIRNEKDRTVVPGNREEYEVIFNRKAVLNILSVTESGGVVIVHAKM